MLTHHIYFLDYVAVVLNIFSNTSDLSDEHYLIVYKIFMGFRCGYIEDSAVFLFLVSIYEK